MGRRVAVTGASGNVGAAVVRLLSETAGLDVVPVVRRPRGLDRERVADYADPPALRRALDGVETLVMVSSDGPVAQVIDHHGNLIDAARAAGVGHVVALSGLDADVASPFCYAQSYGLTERLLRASGCGFSIARASIFSEFLLALIAEAGLQLPMGDGRMSLVSRADVARCLAVLAAGAPTGRCHALTGPEALDGPGLAATLGWPWHDVSPAEFCRDRSAAGEDPWWTYAFSSMFASVREQRWAVVSVEVERLTGRPPAAIGDASCHA